MLVLSKVKMRGNEKTVNRNISNKFWGEHIQHFLHKMCNEKVSRCNNDSKEVYKKVCCT